MAGIEDLEPQERYHEGAGRCAVHVLVIEDDPFISASIKGALTARDKTGEVTALDSLQGGLAHLSQAQLLVLDLNLSDSRGAETLERCRQASPSLPIIVVSAIDREDVRIRTLQQGADDYLTKPFSLDELMARIDAVMRRASPPGAASSLRWNAPARQIVWQNTPISLTPLEYAVFEVLAQSPGVAFSRQDILARIIGPNFYGYERVVDVHVGHLRKKLAPIGSEAVQTVRAFGYRWNPDVRWDPA